MGSVRRRSSQEAREAGAEKPRGEGPGALQGLWGEKIGGHFWKVLRMAWSYLHLKLNHCNPHFTGEKAEAPEF